MKFNNFFMEKIFAKKLSEIKSGFPFEFYLKCLVNESKSYLYSSDKDTEKGDLNFLILVYQKVPVDSFCIAIQASTFKSESSGKRLYIKYVDTSGFFNPRSEQSKVTKNLLKSFIQIVSPDECNLFVMPKPFFLFSSNQSPNHQSKNQTSKRILTGTRLTCWWLSILSECFESVLGFNPDCSFQKFIKTEFPAIQFKDEEFFSDKIALFPDSNDDDVKYKHFVALFSEKQNQPTCKKIFFSTLGLKEEFANQNACLLRCIKSLSESDFDFLKGADSIENITMCMQKCDFSTLGKSRESSKKIIKLFEDGLESFYRVSIDASEEKNNLIKSIELPPVKNIQSLIKRKKI